MVENGKGGGLFGDSVREATLMQPNFELRYRRLSWSLMRILWTRGNLITRRAETLAAPTQRNA